MDAGVGNMGRTPVISSLYTYVADAKDTRNAVQLYCLHGSIDALELYIRTWYTVGELRTPL